MIIPEKGATYVDSAAGTTAAAARIADAPDLAIDVETNGMHAFRAKLCFVQVATRTEVFVFDCLAPGVDVRAISTILEDETRTKVIHAAGNDLRAIATAGVRVNGVLDTHRAATLLGLPKVGLADLVLAEFGVTLNKELQKSNFAARPLPAGVFEYIADDVRYLLEVSDAIREKCVAADIFEELMLDGARMADEAVAPPEAADATPEDSFEAVVGAKLDAMRMRWAEEKDVPFGTVLSNAAIKSIAANAPKNRHELARAQGVHGSLVREHGDEILSAVADALAAAPLEKPKSGHLSRPAIDRSRALSEALKAFRNAKATLRNVHPSVVLPNPLLKDLVAAAPESLEALARFPYFGEKRLALYGSELLAILAPPAAS